MAEGWQYGVIHPVFSMYYLIAEKMERDRGRHSGTMSPLSPKSAARLAPPPPSASATLPAPAVSVTDPFPEIKVDIVLDREPTPPLRRERSSSISSGSSTAQATTGLRTSESIEKMARLSLGGTATLTTDEPKG